MTQFPRDLHKTSESLYREYRETLKNANELWRGIIRLTITLSSSFLVLTLAFVEKLFPNNINFTNISVYLKFAWVFLFFTIITGLFAEVDTAIFFGNMAKFRGKMLREIDEKRSQGIDQDVIELPKSYFIPAPFTWGRININMFIFSMLLLSVALIEDILTPRLQFTIVIISLLLLYMFNMRFSYKPDYEFK